MFYIITTKETAIKIESLENLNRLVELLIKIEMHYGAPVFHSDLDWESRMHPFLNLHMVPSACRFRCSWPTVGDSLGVGTMRQLQLSSKQNKCYRLITVDLEKRYTKGKILILKY